jgi:4-amino-4-deoxy-L-arabinose transferase-like glycosyltransferase
VTADWAIPGFQRHFRFNRSKGNLILLLLAFLAVFLLVYRPAEVPPLYFDEGWNLATARNWIEIGHYGPLLDGKPIAGSMLSTGFPAIMPLALSFRLFGIGPWQARLPGILFTAGAIVLIFYVAYRLSGSKIAIGTIAVLLLMPIHPELHPIVIGRMALGEMPALFYILAGYACFLAGREGRSWLRPFATVWWGLALVTKVQVIPFLLLGLIVPLAIALAQRKWKTTRLIFLGLLGTVIAFAVFTLFQQHLLQDASPPQTHISDWQRTIAVSTSSVRAETLSRVLVFALPAVFGLGYAGVEISRRLRQGRSSHDVGFVQISLVVLSGSWAAWFIFLSPGYLRYLLPAMFLSSILTSEMLWGLSNGFKPPMMRPSRQSGLFLLAVALIAWAVPLTSYGLYRSYLSNAGKSLMQVVEFVNTQTPSDAIIECGDAELFFLLNRRYDYALKDFPVSLSMEANPDYLVIGHMVNMTKVGEAVLHGNQFSAIMACDPYTIYKRNR